MPSTTSDITSIVANTGRRTHSSDSMTTPSPLTRDLHAVGQVVDVGQRHHVAQLDAAENLHAVADPIAGLQLVDRQPIAVDGERAVDAVAVLHRGVGDGQDLLDQRGRRGARGRRCPASAGRRRCGASASNGNARVCVLTAGLIRDTLPVNVLSGNASTLHVDRLPDLDPRRHPLGNLGDHLQRSRRGRCSSPASALFTNSPSDTSRFWT